MITIDYQLSPAWNKSEDSCDFSALDETDLRYSALLGDIMIIADGCDFSARWGWVPIIDFAVSLRYIAEELTSSNDLETAFEFTESEAVIRFKRSDDEVIITASYVPCMARIALFEFAKAVNNFKEKVAGELGQQYPALLSNKAFVNLFKAKKPS